LDLLASKLSLMDFGFSHQTFAMTCPRHLFSSIISWRNAVALHVSAQFPTV